MKILQDMKQKIGDLCEGLIQPIMKFNEDSFQTIEKAYFDLSEDKIRVNYLLERMNDEENPSSTCNINHQINSSQLNELVSLEITRVQNRSKSLMELNLMVTQLEQTCNYLTKIKEGAFFSKFLEKNNISHNDLSTISPIITQSAFFTRLNEDLVLPHSITLPSNALLETSKKSELKTKKRLFEVIKTGHHPKKNIFSTSSSTNENTTMKNDIIVEYVFDYEMRKTFLNKKSEMILDIVSFLDDDLNNSPLSLEITFLSLSNRTNSTDYTTRRNFFIRNFFSEYFIDNTRCSEMNMVIYGIPNNLHNMINMLKEDTTGIYLGAKKIKLELYEKYEDILAYFTPQCESSFSNHDLVQLAKKYRHLDNLKFFLQTENTADLNINEMTN